MTITSENMRVQSIIYLGKGKKFILFQDYYQNNMDDMIKKIETFLAYSDQKLEELHAENQKLKEDTYQENK
ncbi:hypothetical protein SS13_contig00019-0032 [Streptococcus parauberis]|nr:hypothetical protein SS13_contig00019-0032 [Streptococcus parauberis]